MKAAQSGGNAKHLRYRQCVVVSFAGDAVAASISGSDRVEAGRGCGPEGWRCCVARFKPEGHAVSLFKRPLYAPVPNFSRVHAVPALACRPRNLFAARASSC